MERRVGRLIVPHSCCLSPGTKIIGDLDSSPWSSKIFSFRKIFFLKRKLMGSKSQASVCLWDRSHFLSVSHPSFILYSKKSEEVGT